MFFPYGAYFRVLNILGFVSVCLPLGSFAGKPLIGAVASGSGEVALRATFLSSGNIRDEGAGAFVHNVQGARVVIDASADLLVTANYTRARPPREGTYDLRAPLNAAPYLDVATAASFHFKVQEVGTMAVGEVRYINGGGSIVHPMDGKTYQIRFGSLQWGAADIKVTRISESLWVAESDPESAQNALVQRVEKNGSVTVMGQYYLPFHLTFEKL